MAYTFLLNRFQLSRLNGWVNRDGEVFVIFPRESLAEEMQISYRKAIECFKEFGRVVNGAAFMVITLLKNSIRKTPSKSERRFI